MAGLLQWIQTYGQYIGFLVQLVFYAIVAASALWAAITFNRYVVFMMGVTDAANGGSAAGDASSAAKPSSTDAEGDTFDLKPADEDEDVSVDEFVD